MKMQALRDQIVANATEAIKDAIYNHKRCAGAEVDSEFTNIDLFVTANGGVEAVVTHYGKIHKTSPNLEAWCEDILRTVSWAEVKDEVDAENAPTFEEEYAQKGESLFRPELRWHRI